MPKRRGSKAAVDIQTVTPVGRETDAPMVGRSPDMLIAEHEGRMVASTETVTGEDGPVQTTHTRPGTLVMYKPTEGQGYVPRVVSGSAVRLLLRQGWQEFCPDCKQRHIDKDGNESTDPNLCSAREPVAVRVCRVCDKRIYDNQGFRFEGDKGTGDPNVIEDDVFAETTPADRTRASLNLHYWVRHPRQAQMMGLPPLPAALQDMVEKDKVANVQPV